MTARRRITSSLRSGLMMMAGTALIALPVALDLGGAAILTGIVVGVIATGLGIAGTGTEGRGTLPLSAHAVYDRGLAVGLLLAAVLFGLTDQHVALALFGSAGIAQLALGSLTRYTASHA